MQEQPVPLEEDSFEDEILVEEETTVVNAMWGDIGGNIENQTDLQNALDAKQDSLTEAQLNAVNSGITAGKVATYDGYADQIASKADQSALNAEATTRGEADTALGTRIDDEALARQSADNGLQTQIDAITSKSDVVDVVANYAALQAYDTSTLSDNDVIKVLDDETHEDALTYYRWSTTTQTWSYIGQEAPYYSKGQMDVMLQGKQDTLTAGDNIQIENGTISSTDTTYTAGNGLNLNGTEFSADTDVLATKSDLENYYTKPETDNLLAPKLEAEVVAGLPTTGEEGKLYLAPKPHTTQTATGNPITATITEQAGKMESFRLDGDTFQRSYGGKNLYSAQKTQTTAGGITYSIENGVMKINGTRTEASNLGVTFPITYEANTTYTCSVRVVSGSLSFDSRWGSQITFGNVGGSKYVTIYDAYAAASKMATISFMPTEDTTTNLSFWFGYESNWTNKSFNNIVVEIQIEVGSSATSFEPYVGGTPSPNPDYPQPIQVVTGEQTISINGTDYPIDLGSIELCRLGTYQDYIYKDGDSWKVHKATGYEKKIVPLAGVDGHSSVYGTETTSNGVFAILSNNWGSDYDITAGIAIASSVIGVYQRQNIDGNNQANSMADGTFCQRSGTNDRVYFRVAAWARSKTVNEVYRMITDNGGVDFWYPLATPTDTIITDTNLIAQLEAIRTASLQNGANTITNTATGSNLAGDMEIGYYGYNPRNRYDKWLWLDINNEYEQIGS